MSSISGTSARALVGERVLDARGNLGVGRRLDDALLLEGPEAEREGARADPLEGALQLAEAKRGVGEVADDEEGPLAGDDLSRPADRAFAGRTLGAV